MAGWLVSALAHGGALNEAAALLHDHHRDDVPFDTIAGRLLWAAHRFEEAKPAFERYLELEPHGANAAQIKSLISEPK